MHGTHREGLPVTYLAAFVHSERRTPSRPVQREKVHGVGSTLRVYGVWGTPYTLNVWGMFRRCGVCVAGTATCLAFHQQPDVNYIEVLEKVDFPCTVNAQRLPFKGNQLRAETG